MFCNILLNYFFVLNKTLKQQLLTNTFYKLLQIGNLFQNSIFSFKLHTHPFKLSIIFEIITLVNTQQVYCWQRFDLFQFTAGSALIYFSLLLAAL